MAPTITTPVTTLVFLSSSSSSNTGESREGGATRLPFTTQMASSSLFSTHNPDTSTGNTVTVTATVVSVVIIIVVACIVLMVVLTCWRKSRVHSYKPQKQMNTEQDDYLHNPIYGGMYHYSII